MFFAAREAVRREAREEGRREGRREERARIIKALADHGVTVPLEIADILNGKD